jgi:hypothetical protein
MSMGSVLLRLIALLAVSLGAASGQTITWSSLNGATNLTSNGTAMDGNFRFELGVFEGDFIPTTENTGLWAQYWRPAQSIYYLVSEQPNFGNRFAGSFVLADNNPPFISGKKAYIWGFRGSPQQTEWILFTNSTWEWPEYYYNPLDSVGEQISWVAEDPANNVIIGEIDAGRTSFLMKSASVTHWADWQTVALAGEALNGPNNDPDNDGASNLLEFVMGTNPKASGGVPATPVTIVPFESNKHLQITIPRRIDRPAILTVEVANHPAGNQPGGTWNSGPSHTTLVSSDINSLIVRDNTPISPSNPHRFMRLKVELPPQPPPP